MTQVSRKIDAQKTIAAVVEEFGSVREFCRQVDESRTLRFYRVLRGAGHGWGASKSVDLLEKLAGKNPADKNFLRYEGGSDE